MITAWIIGIRERIVYPMRLRFRYFDFSDDFSLEGESIDIGDGAIIWKFTFSGGKRHSYTQKWAKLRVVLNSFAGERGDRKIR